MSVVDEGNKKLTDVGMLDLIYYVWLEGHEMMKFMGPRRHIFYQGHKKCTG